MYSIWACLKQVDWSVVGDITAAVASIIVAVVAYKGLSIWKQQSHVNIQIQFLDELLSKTNEYILLISSSIKVLKCIEVGV